MSEEEKWAIVDAAVREGSGSPEDIAIAAIRETLRRAPKAWPGEAKPAEPEWIDWHGGECPVPAGTRVEVRYRCGQTESGPAAKWMIAWRDDDCAYDIIAYRIMPGEPS